MANKLCTVYALVSSEDDRVRYVGQTQKPISKRLTEHLAAARKGNTIAHKWIRKTLSRGYDVKIIALEESATLNDSEVEWIAFFRTVYSDLTNISNGGDQGTLGLKLSEEVKAKMRKPKSAETRKLMSKPKSAETRAKMSLAQVGNTKGLGELNGKAVLTESDVKSIRDMVARGVSLQAVANEFCIQKAAVWKIKEGRTWSHVA